ncbi:uncharacterized protein N7479_003858 [Penicillium vulpinum]|uniref:Uncharacterized protein n=1 Tax=Penicillium vulpinum TaxID=29845 RepID=A0A1V6RGC9_9EURO|nr:uncharacterized protein N7479_003858 [Penicillium vulpinum]KAJ5963982.1 hypothetical protein N7479_003858 [Penicillium vulpinum]OQE00558.1 hypothetical protein PENVUL_c050G03140 [Penicillium vulpinum]
MHTSSTQSAPAAKRARHSTGHRDIPQPTPEQRPKNRCAWSPGRRSRHTYLMAKKGLLGNRRPASTDEERAECARIIQDAEAAQGFTGTEQAQPSSQPTPARSGPTGPEPASRPRTTRSKAAPASSQPTPSKRPRQ